MNSYWDAYLNDDFSVGNYGEESARILFEMLDKAGVEGKHCLVIGSVSPWVEGLALAMGARHVTTLEYGQIVSQHPQVEEKFGEHNFRVFGEMRAKFWYYDPKK